METKVKAIKAWAVVCTDGTLCTAPSMEQRGNLHPTRKAAQEVARDYPKHSVIALVPEQQDRKSGSEKGRTK